MTDSPDEEPDSPVEKSLAKLPNEKKGLFYDKQGNEIGLRDWVRLIDRSIAYRHVAEDMIGDVRISTVWLGVNMEIFGPPVIFETMTFSETIKQWDRQLIRYSTEEEALAGHEAICAEVRVMSLQDHMGD